MLSPHVLSSNLKEGTKPQSSIPTFIRYNKQILKTKCKRTTNDLSFAHHLFQSLKDFRVRTFIHHRSFFEAYALINIQIISRKYKTVSFIHKD